MFHYPVPIPSNTHYQQLDLTPEATHDEVQSALRDLEQDIKAQQGVITKQIEEVYSRVPGMKEAEEKVESLKDGGQADAAGSASDDWNSALKKRDAYRAQACRIRGDFGVLQKKSADLNAQVHELHNLPLNTTEKRAEYDREHPPLDLLKLEDCARDLFAQPKGRRLAIALLRQELADFFPRQGVEVYHPSDLTRQDFSSDFMPLPIFDETEP